MFSNGTEARPLTWSNQDAGLWMPEQGERSRCAWPTFSPDGSRLAVVCIDALEPPAPGWVEVHDVDGVEGRVVFSEPDTVPLHVSWSPSGSHVAVIAQQDESLALWVCDVSECRPRLVEEGVPLFCRWMPDGRRLVVHAGDDDGAAGRLVIRDAIGSMEDVLLPHHAGSFCTPQVVGERLITVTLRDGMSIVVSTDFEGQNPHELWRDRGMLAVVGLADDESVGVAAVGSRGRYRALQRVPLDGAPSRELCEGPLLAFVPVGGDRVVVAQPDHGSRQVRWSLCDGSECVALGTMLPSQDQLFHLHFFEQLTQSHRACDRAQSMLIQGTTGPEGARVVGIDLREPGRVHVLGEGSYGVFPP